jgi:hypothetical protein
MSLPIRAVIYVLEVFLINKLNDPRYYILSILREIFFSFHI